jgi:choline dehydrogenase-like flavoprotein
VLVLEKGPRLPARALYPDEVGACLRDAFVPFVSEDPHVLWEHGRARKSHEGWTACCVGGGTVHMSAMLYRMHAEDFDAVARFGKVAGTTAIDWPLRYRDLRPYYDRIQAEIGLSGETGANPFEPEGAPYPLPPLTAHPAAAAVERAARALGLHPFPTPRGILSASYRGRRACVQCGYCGAYACPVSAKASSADVFLARAEASGRCRVLPGAPVLRIEARGGRAHGVIALDRDGGRHALHAPQVVLAASAVESARLLLASDSAEHAHGLGNASGQVGKNLLFSLEAAGRAAFAFGSELFPRAHEALPFLNCSVQDHYLDPAAPGGYPKLGTLVLERAHPHPIQRARRVARAGGVVLGAKLVERIGRTLRDQRELVYESFIEMLPRPGLAVSLDSDVRGDGGLPAARIHIDELAGESERAVRLAALGRELLGALRPLALADEDAPRRTLFLQVGTCRMGSTEDSSVCDASGQVWGVEGLVIADGSALPSMGGVPPTLTIMANALRVAELMLRRG